MVNLRSPVVKISWPIHLPGRNLSQHSSWSTCCLSWTNRIFSPFWGSLSKWTLWWQPSSLTKSPPTFIMVNLLSLVDKPYLYPLWARQASGPSDDNHLPCRYHRQHCSEDSAFDNTISSLAFSNPAGRSHIENQAWGPSTLPNSLLILRWPLTPEDVDQDISSHLQLMSIKMWLNHSLNTSRCILLKMNVEIIFTCNSSE